MNEHSLGRRSFLAMGLSAAIVAVGGCSGGGGGTSSAAKKASDITVKEVVIGTAADSTGPAPAVSGARTGGAVKIINNADFDHLDPQAMFKGYTQTAAELFTRKLTGYKEQDGKLVLVGDLATDTGATTDGGKTWEYTLKDGIRFQDGTAITSADIKYGIERSYEPTIVAAAGPSYIQSWLSGGRWAEEYKGPWKGDSLPDSVIETPDDKTIVFHLREAVTTFPYAAALPTTSPVAKELDTKARYDRMPVSTGPYKIESHDDTSMTLVRNEHWDPSTDPIGTTTRTSSPSSSGRTRSRSASSSSPRPAMTSMR